MPAVALPAAAPSLSEIARDRLGAYELLAFDGAGSKRLREQQQKVVEQQLAAATARDTQPM